MSGWKKETCQAGRKKRVRLEERNVSGVSLGCLVSLAPAARAHISACTPGLTNIMGLIIDSNSMRIEASRSRPTRSRSWSKSWTRPRNGRIAGSPVVVAVPELSANR